MQLVGVSTDVSAAELTTRTMEIAREGAALLGWDGHMVSNLTALDDQVGKGYGVATPAAAGMVLLPLILGIETGWDFFRSAWLTLPWTIMISGLMIAPIPTYSFKHIRVPKKFVTLSLASVGLLAAALITEPWLTLSALIVAFSASIPFAVLSFKKRQNENEFSDPSGDVSSDDNA